VPGADIVLARAARLQAEASDLLDVLADQDIGIDATETSIALTKLQEMPAHRARNALRRFLRRHGALMPEAGRLDELLRQALTARADARVCVNLGDVELRRFRGTLYAVAPLPPLPRNFEMAWHGRGPLELPQLGGSLHLEQCRGSGIAAKWLQHGRLTVRVRRGGEVLLLASGGQKRTVRNLLQERAMPPWMRERLPLLYLGDELAAVPGIGVHARFRCAPDEKGLIPVWSPALPS